VKKKLRFKRSQFFMISALSIILLIISISGHAQNTDIVVPSSHVKLIKTFKLNSSHVEVPAKVDSVESSVYSDITTFTGSAIANEGSAVQSGNTITALMADSLGLIGTPPFSVHSFKFSVANFDVVDITARTLVRFYSADGTAGSPGTLIAGFSLPPFLFSASTVELFNITDMPFTVTTQAIWAGIVFDNDTATTGATAGDLDNLGQGIFDPIDKGSSTDDIFATNTAGSFLGDNPPGTTGNLFGSPLANFGWEIVSASLTPVTLYNFKVQRSGQINILTWGTSQELNSNYFAVERGIDGTHFVEIGKVKAVGNSSVARSYHYDDVNRVKGINYYRLRIVDIDNSIKYSDIITVRNTGAVNFTIYPNPVNNSLRVNMDAEKAEMAGVSITDINGRKVYSRQVTVTQGNNSFSLDVNTFSKGTYYIKVQLKNGSFIKEFRKL
jgi:hypothetical protein